MQIAPDTQLLNKEKERLGRLRLRKALFEGQLSIPDSA